MKRSLSLVLALLYLLSHGVMADTFVSDLQAWRQARDTALRSPNGWLTLAGLFWLSPGANTFGSAPGLDCRFPDNAPLHIGTFNLAPDGTVTIDLPADGTVSVGGRPTTRLVQTPSDTEGTSVMSIGTLSWYVIRRDGKVAVRLKDSNSPVLTGFHGTENFAPDPRWRIEATFKSCDPPRHRQAPTALGTITTVDVVGTVSFAVNGQPFHLEAIQEPGDTDLTIIFQDATNGHSSYTAGRYLNLPKPASDGPVIVDFNRAYNPPCAFTHFATCIFPHPENCLRIAIQAGEKYTRH